MLNKSDYKRFSEKMDKSIAVLEDQLTQIRAGRANPSILNKITVEYYGVPTPINQLGSINVPEARMLVFQPWDVSVLSLVEKAIQKSDIGINPNNDGKVIRIAFPPLTEERRKELTKQVKKMGEDTKIAIRAIEGKPTSISKPEKKSEITEDELKVAEKGCSGDDRPTYRRSGQCCQEERKGNNGDIVDKSPP